MRLPHLLPLSSILALVPLITAQTSTSCNPLNATCDPDSALGTEHSWWFNTSLDSSIWEVTNGEISHTSENGTLFSIKEKLDSPTLASKFYIFFGIVESHVKMAKGGGVVSSIVLESDDLDEIDWEWVGYNTTGVQSNYFGKGNTTTYNRAGYHYVPDADTEFHNYTTYWTSEKLEWWIDGSLVRTLNYSDAVDGKNFPQTPCNVRYGIWPGGDPSEGLGTIEWAGGEINYTAGPYNMYVKRVRVQDFHSGKEYVYSNHSGDWESIKVVKGNSTAKTELNKAPTKSLSQKFAGLSTAAKDGIYASVAIVIAAVLGAWAMFCVRQRRQGRREKALGEAGYEAEGVEMMNTHKGWDESRMSTGKGYQKIT
ncbi:cell wall glucanase [Aspergillus ellipticus CBS 707.79]|uniref:chitinase n=1 Tax=Aspergillus ellipticus CBS 707.79 TaxID=1448320 RepID=A0A319D245_9EURO|nr:cell wall glucanase [Aspergillus ellipticus CBS 707.79]